MSSPVVHLFGDLNATGDAQETLDVTVDSELASSDATNHEQTGTDTGVRATEAKLLADLEQTGHGTLTRGALGLVDLAQHGVSGLRNESGGETGDETGAQVDTGLGAVGGGLLVDGAVDALGNLLEDDELGHGVRDPEE